ncbi:hypothetical protein [Euryhalocaulis caribicus]|uniref:hypothetical protein n=1 Tax=Euryhalocaulis caribicus TaxID=1161401 RepID=UPI0003B48731|nr:hypothetical protein [Euryhalocaulis caribicus]
MGARRVVDMPEAGITGEKVTGAQQVLSVRAFALCEMRIGALHIAERRRGPITQTLFPVCRQEIIHPVKETGGGAVRSLCGKQEAARVGGHGGQIGFALESPGRAGAVEGKVKRVGRF